MRRKLMQTLAPVMGDAKPSWAPVDRLRDAVMGGRDLDGAFAAVEQLLVEALHRDDRAHLNEGWRKLRRVHQVVAAQLPDEHEAEPAFHAGRLAELVELFAAAAQRTRPPEVEQALSDPDTRQLLVQVGTGAVQSRELAARLSWDESKVSRRLKRLDEVGLVLRRRVGKQLVSRLSPLGAPVASELEEARPDAAPGPTCWRPVIASPVEGVP